MNMQRMRLLAIGLVVPLASLVLLGAPAPAVADGHGDHGDKGVQLRARLVGFQEVPAISTTGKGEFRGKISKDGTSIEFEVSYEDLQGEVTQSHIHIGQRGVNGGIVLFLCTNLAPPAGVPLPQPCPKPSGTVTGTSATMSSPSRLKYG
jgi:hypothetical protein